MAEPESRPVVVMGVQGSGKSTIGALLAQAMNYQFLDGDDLHSAEAKAKMAAGKPLDDHDREPWLKRVGTAIAEGQANGITLVVACSALKEKYRSWIRALAPDVLFVHLEGAQSLVAQRLAHRNHEYMPTQLLDSQFQTLEPLTDQELGLVVNIDSDPNTVVGRIAKELISK